MIKWCCILILAFAPFTLKSQSLKDSSAIPSYSLMFNVSTTFYTAMDTRINSFLTKYNYSKPQNVPVGLRFEIALMPSGGKMVYGINAGTVISNQDIVTADMSLGAYYRFFETKNFWILAGLSVGEHFDRIVLNGELPPSFDSLAKKYNTTLSLHRDGIIIEPATKFFWYPFKTKKTQLGLFTGIYYDFDFNSRWRVGYYPENSKTFKNLRKPTNVATVHEFGWVFSSGLSICF
jgi:hypothetical protein